MIAGDTIAAFSSALAPSARIILRMSGPDSVKRATDICPQLSGKPGAFQFWLQWDSLRCPAWLYVFRAPASYTGEDLIEFHLPGSVPLAKMLLDELLRRGARLAEPGEFTARGYFSGRMDLAEAEGVAATIAAGNNQQLLAARQLAGGELGRRLAPIIDSLTRTLALVELGIDFSEEDVTFMQAEEVARQARQVDQSLEQLLSETARFERLGTEPRIVLVGRPNAGKSTLINRLAGHSRAVVSDISGTTRDVLSAEVKLADGFVQVVDVAGIEERVAMPSDPISEIEHRAQEQSRRALAEADHIILLREITDERPNLMFDRNIDLLVISKSDLSKEISTDGDIAISAATGFGIDRLKELLNDLAFRQTSGSARLALNRRHVISLETARRALVDVWQQNDHPAAEVMAMQIREALDSLGEVLGKVSPDDVLGEIFSGFCIGK